MQKYNDRVVECNESKADELLGTGPYVLIGCFVDETPSHSEGVGYVERRMVYCLAKKEYVSK